MSRGGTGVTGRAAWVCGGRQRLDPCPRVGSRQCARTACRHRRASTRGILAGGRGAQRQAARLYRLGSETRARRSTVLLDRAAELLVSVPSDLLGVSIRTAAGSSQETGSSRPGCAKAASGPPPPPRSRRRWRSVWSGGAGRWRLRQPVQEPGGEFLADQGVHLAPRGEPDGVEGRLLQLLVADRRVEAVVGVRLPQGDGADGREEAVLVDRVADAQAQQRREFVQLVGEDAETGQGATGRAVDVGQPVGSDLTVGSGEDPEVGDQPALVLGLGAQLRARDGGPLSGEGLDSGADAVAGAGVRTVGESDQPSLPSPGPVADLFQRAQEGLSLVACRWGRACRSSSRCAATSSSWAAGLLIWSEKAGLSEHLAPTATPREGISPVRQRNGECCRWPCAAPRSARRSRRLRRGG